MSEAARLMLLLALAGAGVTFVGSALIWVNDPARRMQRSLKRVLNALPDAMMLSPFTGRGAGFNFNQNLAAVTWNSGEWCLVYRIDELAGCELLIDGQVMGRVRRDETNRPVERLHGADQSVSLRLIFDDPRHPDFDVQLWSLADERRREAPSPAEAITEANSWLARTEAILRRPRSPAPVADVAPRPEPKLARPPEDEDETDELPF